MDLKQQREKRKISQREMARLLNTPVSTYIKWENGSRRVPGIVKIALRGIK